MHNADLLREFRALGLQDERALEAGCKRAWTHLTLLMHTFKTVLYCKSPRQSLSRFLEQGQQVLGADMTRLFRQFQKVLARIDYLLLGGGGTRL